MEAAEDADPRGKRDPRDFALWKGWKKRVRAGDRRLASPRGARAVPAGTSSAPRWPSKYLGPAFDIHGGGVDLRFPHHENEQAQSRAAGHPFASYWMHNAWITTAGEKMSKSLGNSLLIPAVLERVRGIELRYYMVAAHYRSPRRVQLRGARGGRDGVPPDRGLPRPRPRRRLGGDRGRRRRSRCAEFVDGDGRRPRHAGRGGRRSTTRVREGNRLHARRRRPTALRGTAARQVRAMLDVLGLDPAGPGVGRPAAPTTSSSPRPWTPSSRGLLEQRAEARADKDFAAADAIRDQIKAAGIEIEDTPDGPKWSLEQYMMAGNSPAQGRDQEDRQGQPHRRLRRPGPPRARGRGPDAQGQGPPEPQGLQGPQQGRQVRGRAPEAARDGHHRRRVGRRPQLRRRGAARRHPGDRGVRRRGGRARRPAARGVPAWPPSGASACSR